jgi:AraC-like DNA-binding protein
VQQLEKHNDLEPYVKDIYLLENNDHKAENNLPFFADGYPGIVYTESIHPFYLKPKNKRLSDFYLFGQTIEPITLYNKGSFRLIALILYPFSVRMLLGVNPKILNDDCFDLKKVKNVDTASTVSQIRKTEGVSEKLGLIAEYLNGLVKLALNLIIHTRGRASIREVYKQLFVTERTFERRFMKEIGISPKQFASIIQFSSSMKKLSENEFSILTDVGLESGYADQSHFIRTFKKYAGKTPSEFLKSNRI